MRRTGEFVVSSAHPALPGHFPGQPVVPGSVILNEVLALWAGACAGIPAAKFHAPLAPDQVVRVDFDAAGGGLVRFLCRCGERTLCSGILRAAMP